jgi:hypothetical protein
MILLSCGNDEKNPKHEANLIGDINEYQGIYHFGESEMETSFILIVTKGKCYAQIQSGSFNEDATDWIWSYENLRNVRIEGNKFYSDKTNGEFLQTNNGEMGLKVNQTWSAISEDDNSEIGYKTQEITSFYYGNYPEASLKLMSEEELKNYTKSKLSIMRNEIFARYGYIFKKNGEVGNYFNNQKWYKGQHQSVTHFLTGIEKENIALIKRMEENALDDSKEFTLENFPKKWFMLNKENKTSDEFVINKWCEAETQQITFEKDDSDNWVIYVNYGQEADKFNLLDFKATEKKIELYQVVSGHFVIKKPDYAGGETVDYNFMWNKDLMFCNFYEFFGETAMMVSEQNKSNYKTIEENCDYLQNEY